MTLNVKISKGIEYLYFQAGKESIYIGPRADPARAKLDNVLRSLKYAQERTEHYMDSLEELLPFLPRQERERFLLRNVSRLNGRIKKYTSKASKE